MSVYTMPSLGADMESGKLVEWLVKPGDPVKKGDIVAVVETQKGAIEIEIFETATIAELLAAPGQTLPVGAPLARLESPGEAAAATVSAPEPTATAPARKPEPVPVPPAPRPAPAAPARPVAAPRPSPSPGAAVMASPAARTRATEAGLDLASIEGSGPGGAVLLADVERHLAAGLQAVPETALQTVPEPITAPAAPPPPRVKPGLDMAEMRKAIAAAMTRAKREIPHYYLSHLIDLQPAAEWLAAENARRTPDTRLLMGALLARAVVRALARVPALNGRFEGEPYAPVPQVNLGIAIALRGGGLIAPAILGAERLDLDATMAAMRDLVARTRAGRLRNSEVTQGTITVTSLGDGGVDALLGVIYPPQVAIVGFGTPRPQPMVSEGAVVVRMAVSASLAADHRVSDGRLGAQFLTEIATLLQEPASL